MRTFQIWWLLCKVWMASGLMLIVLISEFDPDPHLESLAINLAFAFAVAGGGLLCTLAWFFLRDLNSEESKC